MKKTILFIGLCLLTLSCTKDNSSKTVKFNISTSSTAATKTAYSGATTSGYERIDWVAGDRIRIWSEECAAPATHYADYKVTGVSPDGKISNATVAAVSASLNWDTPKDYTFWSLYPSPSTVSDGSIQMDKAVLTLTLPEAQPETVNMGLGYLAGINTVTYVDEDTKAEIQLSPMTSTFVINLKNETDEDITVKSVTFSSASQAVRGTYEVNLTTNVLTVPAYSADDNSSITVTPATAKVVKAVDASGNVESMAVTIFAVPQDITDAKLSVETNKGTRTISLQNKDLTSYVFKGKWKYNMTFTLPELGIVAGTEPINPETEETEWADVQVGGTTSSVKPSGDGDIWD